jgi:hypothetical protein
MATSETLLRDRDPGMAGAAAGAASEAATAAAAVSTTANRQPTGERRRADNTEVSNTEAKANTIHKP